VEATAPEDQHVTRPLSLNPSLELITWHLQVIHSFAAPPELPTPGYELFPLMGYYKFHSVGRTWREALHTCAQEGAHLAIINSQEEANLIRSLYDKNPKVQNATDNHHAFLGYHDLYTEGQFETILGNCNERFNIFECSGLQRPPLWSSGQSSWLLTQRSGFYSRRYQIF
jgi:hypothetical protein